MLSNRPHFSIKSHYIKDDLSHSNTHFFLKCRHRALHAVIQDGGHSILQVAYISETIHPNVLIPTLSPTIDDNPTLKYFDCFRCLFPAL